MNPQTNNISAAEAVAHLQPDTWLKVNRLHVRKIIAEFAHELLITPVLQATTAGWGHYTLSPAAGIDYSFRAQLLSLDHWHIDTASIEKTVNGAAVPLDAVHFITEFSEQLGFDPVLLPTYLEEIISTLYGSAYMHTYNTTTATELTAADYQDIEHAMMAGHPCFVANNGRIGYDTVDYRKYAPEAATPFPVIWLAGHKSRTVFTGIDTLQYEEVLQQELDTDTITSFHGMLKEKGLQPEDYYLMPTHPWQWYNKLASIFSPDIAANNLVCLGYGKDAYLPQQSVRTLFNVTTPGRFYVKSALSILNMGFMRGLSPYYMRTTPGINEWVAGIIEGDAYLQQKGFMMLKEAATMGYTNHYFETAIKGESAYKKMLATLWRESPVGKLQAGQRLMTMAALLHVDAHGEAMLPALIRASGLDITSWLQQYMDCYLSPLLHCFYYYDLRFMPHGENVILILENNVPVKAIMKDIAEEVAVVNSELDLPENVRRIVIPVPEELKILSIFTQIFDCFFRFVSHVLVEHADYPEEQFWALAAECIQRYQQLHPELEEKFKRTDLFADEIVKTCLNRLQIRNNQRMIEPNNPFKSQQFAGTFKNPLAAFKHRQVAVV
ncbi:IucA/IucC family protein [Chitinophaga pinensis]|uniref:IucA/IucC family protein n=1 Tax=Chitinophaga pinensis (strain ATCC 43595 / DSM 2588 / LMG 13176 / NBRC 15968 / NCIMB 11800 / UQM 2034) TaxID=485918 RepID=A0A979G3V0_CHIPD|nr:IucA/IucC family siderophore biosynthesis protein [Chitinophaga pinensis]ACU60315.1 IucA/IucC family protein [Chitinophaga pinensis DSM 2588]